MPTRFSIVVPTLNSRLMLLEALASVRIQAWPDVEIIIVDGGSTDGTQELIAQMPGVRLIPGPDRGVYDALNKGIAVASGDVVGLLNSDDQYEPGTFSAVMQAFKAHPGADAICGGAVLVNEGRVVEIYNRETDKTLASPRPIFIGACIPNARFFRRDAIRRVGDFRVDYRFIADRDWLARFYKNKLITVALPNQVYRYRQHPGSLTFGGNPARQHAIREELLRMAREWRDDAGAPEDLRHFAELLEGRCTSWLIGAAIRRGDWAAATRLATDNGHGCWPPPAVAMLRSALDVARHRLSAQ
jgi:glycosyltransferase involved in cell wall biosynthesis